MPSTVLSDSAASSTVRFVLFCFHSAKRGTVPRLRSQSNLPRHPARCSTHLFALKYEVANCLPKHFGTMGCVFVVQFFLQTFTTVYLLIDLYAKHCHICSLKDMASNTNYFRRAESAIGNSSNLIMLAPILHNSQKQQLVKSLEDRKRTFGA